MREYLPLFGRFGLTLIFIVEGLHKVLEHDQFIEVLEEKGFPIPFIALICAILIEVLGGMAIVIGYKTSIAAYIMSLYVIMVTIFIHPIWNDMANYDGFVKNIAIIGGLFFVAYFGGGPKSVDTYHKD